MHNAVKQKWAAGEPTYGCWLSLPTTFTAELLSRQDFDWINIDMQHGLIDYQVAVTMLQAIEGSGMPAFVRVPWNEFGIIGKMLDAGAVGIIIPMVNSAAEAEQAVAACRYFPDGQRSFGPTRGGMLDDDYYATANAEIACIPMIETEMAVNDIDAILSVPGIDAIYVGPADLSLTLGLPPGADHPDPFASALETIADGCKRHGVIAGIHANAALAQKRVDGGYQMIAISGDYSSMMSGAKADIKTVRG